MTESNLGTCHICGGTITRKTCRTKVAGRLVHEYSCEVKALKQSQSDLLRYIRELRASIREMAKTASGTYNTKRVSVSKERYKHACTVAELSNLAELELSESEWPTGAEKEEDGNAN